LSFEYSPAAPTVALECLERLAALGRYRFNWSRGETHELALAESVSAEDMRAALGALSLHSPSGDVYAVLQKR
jgi:hypothetical protein